MGDRANVAFAVYKDAQAKVVDFAVLYTHWSGSELATTVQAALKKGWRWDDQPYLTRITFDAMTDSHNGEETGYGILANSLCDNEHPVIFVDCEKKTVSFVAEAQAIKAFDGRKLPKDFESWSFADYSKLTEKALEKAWNCNREGVPR